MNERGMVGELTLGALVVAMEGEELGNVKEIRGPYFKVDAPLATDYWLRTDSIRGVEAGRVLLAFASDQLNDYKTHDPDDAEAMSREGARAQYREEPVINEHDRLDAKPTSNRELTEENVAHSSFTGYKPTVVPADKSGFSGGEWNHSAIEAYRREWETGVRGDETRRWDDVEPYYRYGHEMRSDPRYAGRHWSEVEPDLSRGYDAWRRERGYSGAHEQSSWDRDSRHVRSAWDRMLDRGEGRA